MYHRRQPCVGYSLVGSPQSDARLPLLPSHGASTGFVPPRALPAVHGHPDAILRHDQAGLVMIVIAHPRRATVMALPHADRCGTDSAT